MNLSLALSVIAVIAGDGAFVHGFTPGSNGIGRRLSASYGLDSFKSQCILKMTQQEENAKIISEYMVNAHDEKLRAVREVEEKKNVEIKALRAEVAALGTGIAEPAPIAQITTVSTPAEDDLREQLDTYRTFMAEYIVKSHEQKAAAIIVAEAAAEKRFSEKLAKLTESTKIIDVPAPPKETKETKETKEMSAYEKRNKNVSAAADAGKSRWGEKEIEKINGVAPAITAPINGEVSEAPVAPPLKVVISEEVKAADHGLRANGAVGGLSLAERVSFGAQSANEVSTDAVVPEAPKEMSSYEKRNKHISAAAAAGKSRWGTMEVDKINKLDSAITEPINGEVSEAPSAPEPIVAPKELSSYEKRNKHISAAALAGKSRWGTKEVDKINKLESVIATHFNGAASEAPVAPKPTVVISEEVKAADHGLRANGAVGGLSLAERVSFGAQSANEVSNGAVEPAAPKELSSYEKRNKHISAAAAAGKSRWGTMEVDKINKLI